MVYITKKELNIYTNMKRFLLFCLMIVMTLSLHAKGNALASDSVLSVSVAEALSIGYQLTGEDTFAYSESTYSITGFVSYLVPASSNYEVNGSQTFWITDEQGSTAHTNAEGAIRVYYGKPNQEAQVGDKVQVVGPIMKATLSSGGVQVDTKSYATVTILESGTPTDPTGTTQDSVSAIQVGDFYYEIRDYGYGAFAELVRVPGSTGYSSYTNLSGDITIPGLITYNGTSYQVRAIDYQALNGSGISSVTVGEGVEYIYNFAFMDCSSLTTVTLPSTIVHMGNQVFGWSGLKTLTINATTPPSHGEREYCLMDANYVEHIYVPASSVAAYKADTVWANHASIIEAIPEGTDPTTPTTEPLTVTWDSINGLTTIDISQYTNYNFGGEIETFNDPNFVSKEIDGITATISATVDGSYARVLTYEGNTSISVSGGGTLTFSAAYPIQSIVINFDPDQGVVNVNSASDWTVTAGDATSIQVSQVIWSGTPTYSVVLEDAYISYITSIVFTFASGTGTDPGTSTDSTSTAPTAMDLLNAGFNPRANAVLALYFDVAPCNDVVLAGSYATDSMGNWIMDPDQLAHFTRVEGFDGWYAAEMPYANTSITVKPVQLDNDGSLNWNYQAGDADAWIYKGGDQLSISSSYAGEADVTIPSLGAYTYELAYWKNGNTPCADKSHNYTIYLMAPQCETVEPGIYGELNNWGGTPMTLTSLGDRNAYVCQVTAAEGSTFMFSDVKMGGDNGILYFDASNNEWNYLEEITLPQASSDTALFFDFSSPETYQWADCPKNIKLYTVILIAPECDSVTPAIIGTFDQWTGTRMREISYGQQKAYMYQVSDEPGSAFKFFDAVRGWDNEIQYYDSISGWLGMPNYEFPNIEADTATLVYDLSDASMYCWALCKPAEPVYHHVVLTSNNPNFGAVYGDTVLTWPDSIVTIGATAAEGYVFSKWADGNLDNPRRVIVTTDTAFMAIFKLFKYTITVVAEDPTMGAVMGGGTYAPNEQVTIMATPYKGCQFVQWADGNRLNPRSFRAQGDSTYTAVFRRDAPVVPVICSDTMYFTSADSIMMATRVYHAADIEAYDKLIIATIDNKNVMGFQFKEGLEVRNYRAAVEYTKNINITNVSVVEAVPNGSYFRLRVTDGELAPRCEDCTSATNQLYATATGADWYFAEYDSVVVPESFGYDNRMILYNDESMRFSSYRQLTSVDRRQTTVFKLHTKRDIPVEPVIIVEDTTVWQEEEPIDSIQVEVVPQDTVAVISTPHVEYVYSFTLIIWADEAHTQVLLVITYDADGQQISVTRPSAVRRLPAAGTAISFEVNDLKPNQVYHYTLVACEDDGSILTSLNSSFTTTTDPVTDLRNLFNGQDGTIKLILDGQLIILRNGKWYNALGVPVK